MIASLYAAVAGLAVGVALLAGSYWAGHSAAADSCRASTERAAAVAAQEHAQQSEAYREIETLRRRARDQELTRAQQDAAQDARRAAELGTAAEQLRAHVARLAAACASPDRPAAGSSAPAAGPSLVLANLYRGVDDEAQELAAAFDRARRSGLACERIHDSLRSAQ